jgi:PAS domain S-box-containing protein
MSILGDRDRMLAQSQRMAHVGSWELDLDNLADVNSNPLRWSDECYRIFGYEPGTVQVTNDLFFQSVHPDDRAAITEAVAKALRENRPYEIENRIIRADGVERIVYQWADIAKDPTGRPLRMLGTCQDVTERRRAEQELRESEARFRQLADNLPEGFIYQVIESANGGIRFSYVSRGLETLLGVTPAQAMANPMVMFDQILDEERPRVLAHQEQCARKRTSFDCQFPVRTGDGAIRWLHCRSSPRLVAGGDTVWDGLALDITARKLDQEAIGRLNDQLAARVQELQIILETVPAGISVAQDRECRTIISNGALAEMVNMAPGENISKTRPDAAGVPYRVFKNGVEVPSEQLPMQVAAREGMRVEEERLDVVRADGSVRHVLISAAPLRDSTGQGTGAVGVVLDLTALRRAEDALREAGRRKDEFLAVLAHELRNPLAPIRNAVHMLRLIDPRDPRVRQARDMIERQVAHMTRLIDDLLDVSRIARGQVLLKKERCDLTVIVRQTVEDYRALLESGGLKLLLELPERPVWVTGDSTRLAQSVSNLLHNTTKFTPPGGQVTVQVTAENAQARVRVRDTGIGLNADMLKRIFAPFAQADQGLARSRGGLGLGLALVRGLVELHGGTVRGESEGIGRGATFTLSLPTTVENHVLDDDSLLPSKSARCGLRVLLVEDNRDTALSLKMLLEMFGHEVATAYSGRAGVEAALRFHPDTVLCDLGLPEMDGYEVARALRADPATAGVRLIAVSGYGQEEDRQRSREAGFDDHLVKPADPDVIALLLAKAEGANH